MKKLVYGIGINDVDYNVQKFEELGYTEGGKQVKKLIWICPFYLKWKHMLARCYSEKLHLKRPSYLGCSVVQEWHHLTTFKSWMEKQDWKGKELDKDLLLPGNKTYGPDACIFIDPKLNNFLTERQNHNSDWPVGVHFDKKSGKFRAQCNDITTGKRKQLGSFCTPEQAHQSWLSTKLEQAKVLAAEQIDPRVAAALIYRYENYLDLFP